jgi:hypothetical protein
MWLVQERAAGAKEFRTLLRSKNYPVAATEYHMVKGTKPTVGTVVRVLNDERDLIFLHSEGKTGPVKRR